MVELFIVNARGEAEGIAQCAFIDDGEVLFKRYREENVRHVRLVWYGAYGVPEVLSEHNPEAQP